MPDINAICISPSQFNPIGDSNPYDFERFDQRYLAQGDSWFSIGHIPFWATTNLPSQLVLSRSTLIVNCAKPGTLLAHMTDTSTDQTFLGLLNGRNKWAWDGLLMSGGGNDLVAAALVPGNAGPALRLFLRADEWGPEGPVTRYLSEPGWKTFTDHMAIVIDGLLDQRDQAVVPTMPLILHTYDYVTPRNAPAGPAFGPWLYKAMHDVYAIPATDWDALSDELINRLATFLLGHAAANAGRNLHVINSRGTIERAPDGSTGVGGDWENEIHPTPHGYGLLGKKWRSTLDSIGAPATPDPVQGQVPPTPAP